MAYFKDVAYLITTTIVEDGDGFEVETDVPRRVFINKLAVRATEFYSANALGYKPELQLALRIGDYQGETKLKFNGKEFEVIRTYEKGENIELTCQRFGGVS